MYKDMEARLGPLREIIRHSACEYGSKIKINLVLQLPLSYLYLAKSRAIGDDLAHTIGVISEPGKSFLIFY